MRYKYSIVFTTMAFAVFFYPALGFASVLETADEFAVLGGSTVTNTGSSAVTGDVGLSPGSSITGFDGGPGTVSGTVHISDSAADQAHTDASAAYNGLSGMTFTQDLTGQDLGNLTLTSGVYHFDTSAGLSGLLTLDGQNNNNAFWVFQMGSTLTTASDSSVSLTNAGSNNGVFWQVGSSATLGTGTSFIGNIIANQSITLTTGADILSGRALALNGAVTMDTNNISASSNGLNGGLEFNSSGAIVPVSGAGAGTGEGAGPSTPEPVSSALFLLGGGALAARKLRKKKEAQLKLA